MRRTKAEFKADLIVYLERRHNIVFNGIQPQMRKPPLYFFTDRETGGSFAVKLLLDVPEILNAMRLKFKGGV